MQRYSKNREAILECLRSTTCHPTADWICEELRKDYPNMSVATVYRNLAQLKEAGIIRSMGIVSGHEHFDGNIEPHNHVICKNCGKIVDLSHEDGLGEIVKKVSESTGFTLQDMSFVGVCASCSKN